MTDKLNQIFVALGVIETKGDSTLVMADCRRMLKQCIDELDEKKSVENMKE